MPEYIERELLIEKIVNTPFTVNCLGESDDYKDGVLHGLVAKQHNVIDMIKKQPAADVTEVVRCSECKYFGKELKQGKHSCLNYQLPYCLENDYCSYGIRKDGNK